MSLRALVVVVLVILAAPLAAAQQVVLPPVSLVLTLEVHDQNAWLGMLQEILATPEEAQKNLVVTIPARAGGGRTLVILTPKFTSTIDSAMGTARVVVKGRISGDHAKQMLVPFMNAFSESATGADPNKVTVEYGLMVMTVNVLELRVDDR